MWEPRGVKRTANICIFRYESLPVLWLTGRYRGPEGSDMAPSVPVRIC